MCKIKYRLMLLQRCLPPWFGMALSVLIAFNCRIAEWQQLASQWDMKGGTPSHALACTNMHMWPVGLPIQRTDKLGLQHTERDVS